MNDTQYIHTLATPLGDMIMLHDGHYLSCLCFADCHDAVFDRPIARAVTGSDFDIVRETEHWLRCYFAGRIDIEAPAMRLNCTPFRMAVYEELTLVEPATTVTYGELAQRVARRLGRERFSALSVGTALRLNPISIIIPCHRVVPAEGGIGRYSGGAWRKQSLINSEFNHRL